MLTWLLSSAAPRPPHALFAVQPRTPRTLPFLLPAPATAARRDCGSRCRARSPRSRCETTRRPRPDNDSSRAWRCCPRALRAHCEVRHCRQWPLCKPRRARRRWPARPRVTRCVGSYVAVSCAGSFRKCRLLSRAWFSRQMLAHLLCLKQAAQLVASRPFWAAFALLTKRHARTMPLPARLNIASSTSRALARTRCRR